MPSSANTQHNDDIDRVIDFWFTPLTPGADLREKWFFPNQQVDEHIQDDFGSLIQQARTDDLDSWSSTPRGSLALAILLDQFPRNIYRGSHLSYSSDAKAIDVVVHSISKEFDTSPDLTELETVFLYMPLMHAESVIHQIAGISLFENLIARCLSSTASAAAREERATLVRSNFAFAKAHRDVIMRFGRFPSRNEVLGRTSTAEELAFLKEHPGGFPPGGSGNGKL